jgi:hypothetical protein
MILELRIMVIENKKAVDYGFGIYLGKVVRIRTPTGRLPIYGRLINENQFFITLEKKNGNVITLHKRYVDELQLTIDANEVGATNPYIVEYGEKRVVG